LTDEFTGVEVWEYLSTIVRLVNTHGPLLEALRAVRQNVENGPSDLEMPVYQQMLQALDLAEADVPKPA
jgi:hypothetical protein